MPNENTGTDGTDGKTEDTQQAEAGQKAVTGTEDGKGADPFAELVKDADTRDWLGKRNIKDVETLGKTAREQASLLGNAIRIPGKDATDDERNEYLNKLGRPPEAKAYEFTIPKDLPEDLPYDGERANKLKEIAFSLGLTQKQAAALHDQYVTDTVEAYKGSKADTDAKLQATAKAETEKLVKLWGPLDGTTARANLGFADKALNAEPAAKESLKARGLIGPNNEILDHSLAVLLSKLGMAVYKEDDVLHGTADRLGNPFANGETFNLTKAMQAYKDDPDYARSLIAAAGKKPSDFNLPDK